MRQLTAILIILAIGSTAAADNWPHWRGAGGNGVALNASPPVEWSESKNIRWKIDVPGRGSSSPVIWEDKIFVSTAVPADKPDGERGTLDFLLLCLDRASGKEIWKKTAVTARPQSGTHPTNGYCSASPCTDGERVYAHFGSQGLFCYALDGSLVWKKTNFGQLRPLNGFGEGSSPTIADDMIIVPWDHTGPSVLYALNKRTGDTVWKTDRDEPTCWATPLVVEHAGRKQVIMNGQNYARSYDLATGKELWRCGGQTRRPVASPVAANGLVYVTSGFQGSFMGAFHPDGKGDVEGTKQVEWTLSQNTPDIASPLLSNGRIYFHKGKASQLSCVDAATGKPHYSARRLSGLDTVYSSPVAAGGNVYLTARNGTTVVIKEADELNVVATNRLDETIGATPAPVDDQLFIRGESRLFCIAATK